jgi:hypothetical protein
MVATPLLAQDQSEETRTRFLYGGEISFNYAPKDRGYFNYTDYERDSLRIYRMSAAFEYRLVDAISFLTEVRSDNLDTPRPYALYLRVRPFRTREIDIQVGRVPPVFGTLSRRRYEYDNPLIGFSLPYQYRTALRPDAAPDSPETLFAARARGWRLQYPLGDETATEGLPQVNPLLWDTGVQVRFGREPVTFALALTQGTVSSPRVDDDNSGKQIAFRLGARPSHWLSLGASFARGDYVSDNVKAVLPSGGGDSDQTALGVDAELARGPWLVRAEAIYSAWEVPSLSLGALGSFGWVLEGKYKIRAGLFLAARASGLHFESVPIGVTSTTWDAPVTRIEAGAGYNLHRNVIAKFALQYNERAGGSVTSRLLPGVQLLFWF